MLIQHLIVTYRKIYPSQLINIKQNKKSMHYNTQTLIDSVFNHVQDLLEYGELDISPYNQIQTTNISYIIINKTQNFQDAIKTWNWMSPIQKNCINFRTHFCTAQREFD